MTTTRPVVPLRSVLYMPGANARALEKAKTLDADALILDLEDSVAPDAKDLARTQVAAALFAQGAAERVIVAGMPKLRAAMHLDTVFTFCGGDVVDLAQSGEVPGIGRVINDKRAALKQNDVSGFCGNLFIVSG